MRPSVPRPRRQPSRPSLAPSSARGAVPDATPRVVTEEDVLAFLSQLAPEALDALVARARAATKPIEETPPTLDSRTLAVAAPVVARESVAPEPSVVVAPEPSVVVAPEPSVVVAPEPSVVVAVEHATVETSPPAIPFRATLPSSDFEVLDVAPHTRSSPPPLPARATTPPPAPLVTQPPVAQPIAASPTPSPSVEPTPPPALAPSQSAPPARALSTPDLTDLLFDAMTDLPFFETAVEGGAYCLGSVLRVLPSLAGIVSLFDADKRELVVVYAQGPRAEKLLLSRFSERDALVRAALVAHAPVVETYDGAQVVADRHGAFGEPWSVLVAPVVRDGRLLGTIELVDPICGAPFDDRAREAIRYVAGRWAELIAERGIRLPRLVAPPVDAPALV